jgi:sorbitol-6-phosphate 2-dehydrogenase
MTALGAHHVAALFLRAHYAGEDADGDGPDGGPGSPEVRSLSDGEKGAPAAVAVQIPLELAARFAALAGEEIDPEAIAVAAREFSALLAAAGAGGRPAGAGNGAVGGAPGDAAAGRGEGTATTTVRIAGIGTFGVAPAGSPSAEQPLSGRVAVVTGGARGFGAAISAGFRRRGARVCIADVDEAGARAHVEELNAAAPGGGTAGPPLPDACSLGVDVSSEESVAALVSAVVERFGGLDIFVSNAGVLRAGSVMELDALDLDAVTNVNYRGFFYCTKHAARVMALQNHARAAMLSGAASGVPPGAAGTANGAARASAASAPRYSDIIQINSKSGLAGSKKNGAYSGSKFGGVGLTQSFALELVEHYIKVNAVCPGNFFEGPLWSDAENGLFVKYLRAGKVPGAKSIEDVRRFYEAKVPMGRGCRPDDVVRALLYIIEQQYETGQALPVTGGQTMLH